MSRLSQDPVENGKEEPVVATDVTTPVDKKRRIPFPTLPNPFRSKKGKGGAASAGEEPSRGASGEEGSLL
ncbi:unnamed protein product, partial [Ectocarpus sp. 12 AP-2014]